MLTLHFEDVFLQIVLRTIFSCQQVFPALLAMTPLSAHRGEVDGAVPRPTWLSLVTLGFFFRYPKEILVTILI